MKLTKYLLVMIGVIITGAQASERDIDLDCKYITKLDGKSLSYREALDTAINTYCETSRSREFAEKVQTVIPQAIKLFGKGTQDSKVLEEEKFNYTSFKEISHYFFSELKDISLPFLSNEESKRFAYNLRLYDIDYALAGIIQYHAYQSTGGDS